MISFIVIVSKQYVSVNAELKPAVETKETKLRKLRMLIVLTLENFIFLTAG